MSGFGSAVFRVDQPASAALNSGFHHTPWAALELIGFTVVASLLFLNFWDLQGPERAGALNQFLTNIAVIGVLLYAAAA